MVIIGFITRAKIKLLWLVELMKDRLEKLLYVSFRILSGIKMTMESYEIISPIRSSLVTSVSIQDNGITSYQCVLKCTDVHSVGVTKILVAKN